MNKDSRVCCQLDSVGRFYRAFLSVGPLVVLQDMLIPVFECDGTHMKCPYYNGVCLLLLGKDGDKRNVPLAVGFVSKETCDNFSWFFANCIAAIRLDNCALFTDRGHQREAQKLLATIGLEVHLKFCS